jgi:hypothetical protein
LFKETCFQMSILHKRILYCKIINNRRQPTSHSVMIHKCNLSGSPLVTSLPQSDHQERSSSKNFKNLRVEDSPKLVQKAIKILLNFFFLPRARIQCRTESTKEPCHKVSCRSRMKLQIKIASIHKVSKRPLSRD